MKRGDLQANSYSHLLLPLKVGPFMLRNRITQAALLTNLANADGSVSQRLCDYLGARAKGGVSLIVTEVASICYPEGRSPGNSLRIDDDCFIAGLAELAKSIQHYGAVACLQLHHPGPYANISKPVAPSEFRCRSLTTGEIIQTRALTIQEIRVIEEEFGAAAHRAMQAGFDMVELGGHSGYLIPSFLSPKTNIRTDEYGGTLENRMRFSLRIIENIQDRCGVNFPIGYRFMAEEWLPDGFQLDEARIYARRLQDVGLIYLSVHAGTYQTFGLDEGVLATRSPIGVFVTQAAEIKKEVNIPVFANGGITEPAYMEEIIASGKADAIAIGRPMIAEPDMPVKLNKGKEEEIIKCVRCNYCSHVNIQCWPIACTQNPFAGRERDWYDKKDVRQPRKVIVIGGGPGGMAAAWISARRGHEVILYEKQKQLGGALYVASKPIGKDAFWTNMAGWMVRQVKNSGAEVVLDTEVTPELVNELGANVVIVATGASPYIPDIPGITEKQVMLAEDVLLGRKKVGKKVAVVGGGQVGAETADFIIEKKLADEVTIIEQLAGVMTDSDILNMLYLTQKMDKFGVELLAETSLRAIKPEGIEVENEEMGKFILKADSIVIAMGYKPENKLYKTLLDIPDFELYTVGDCVKPRRIADAVTEGAYIALSI